MRAASIRNRSPAPDRSGAGDLFHVFALMCTSCALSHFDREDRDVVPGLEATGLGVEGLGEFQQDPVDGEVAARFKLILPALGITGVVPAEPCLDAVAVDEKSVPG